MISKSSGVFVQPGYNSDNIVDESKDAEGPVSVSVCHRDFVFSSSPVTTNIRDRSFSEGGSNSSLKKSVERIDISAQTMIPPRKLKVDFAKVLLDANRKTDSELISYARMDEAAALEWVKAFPAEKIQGLLNQTINFYSLACDIRIIAALRGHFSILAWAIENSSGEVPQCAQGWNLAHFAVLHPEGKNHLEQLEKMGISAYRKNDWGATPVDFLEAMDNPAPPCTDPFGAGEPLLPEDYHKQIGSNYHPTPRYTPYSLLTLLTEEYTPINAFQALSEHLSGQYADYLEGVKNNSGKVYVRRMEGESVPSCLHGQLECYANRVIKPGELITVYSGVVKSRLFDKIDMNNDKLFQVDFETIPDIIIDASRHGSMAEYINHSFPNCTFLTFYYHGLPVVGLVAIKEMLPGEVIYANYANLFLRTLGIEPVELNEEGIEEYLKMTNGLTNFNCLAVDDGVMHGCSNLNRTLKCIEDEDEHLLHVEAVSHQAKLCYLAAHPKTLQTLLDDNKISADAFAWINKYWNLQDI